MNFLYKAFFAGLLSCFLLGCDDTTMLNETNTTATVSGKVVIAHDGSGLGNATVRLRIGGEWKEMRSRGGSDHQTGDFIFTGLPINASFYIEIDPAETDLATSYSFGSTQKTDATEDIDGTAGGDEFNSNLASHDVGLIHIYSAKATTVTVKDIADGSVISGLGMWVEPEGLGTGDAKTGSVSAPHIPATEASGVYSFTLPDHGQTISIYVNSLMTDSGVQYQTLNGDQLDPGGFDNGTAGDNGGHDEASFMDRLLTSVVPGQAIEVYLRRSSANTLTVAFELFDEDGLAYTTAGAAIAVTETSSGNILSAVQDAAQSNRYLLTTSFRNNLTYQIANLDLNGDSYPDTQAAVVFGAANTATVTQNGQQEVNIPVTITEMNTSTNVIADVLTTSIVPGLTAEATIAFNQPVTPVGDTPAQVQVNALNLLAASDSGDNIAPLATVLNSAGAAGGIALTNPVGTNFNQYSYTDNTAATAVFTLSGADAVTGNIVDRLETRVDATGSIVSATLTATNASNTVYRLNMDAAAITDLQKVNFSMLVKAVSSDITQVVSSTLWAQSSATASLTDFVLDNGDFINTPTTDLLATTSSLHYTELENVSSTLTNTSGLGACGTSNCVFVAQNKPAAQVIGANEGSLSLVTPAAFYGSVRVTSYVVTSLPASASATVDTTTTVYNGQILVSSTQDEANDLQDAADTDDADVTAVRGNYEYFLADPQNRDLDDKNGNTLDAVFGDAAAASSDRVDFNGWTRGYKRSGLGYRVGLAGLGLPANTANSFLKSVTLDLDVVIAGQRQAGTVTLEVQ